MNLNLDKKKRERFILLQKLYDETGGVADRHLINIRELGNKIGIGSDTALDAFEYLKGEGLTKWMALGGIGTITHWGIKEVEDARDQKPTAHFPANITILTNCPGAKVVSGSGNQLSQESTLFDQRGQKVKYQYNAAGNIGIGAIESTSELISQLNLIKQEVKKACEAEIINELIESKTKTKLLEAIEEAQKPQPNKTLLLSYLENAKNYITGFAELGGLVGVVSKVFEWVSKNFK